MLLRVTRVYCDLKERITSCKKVMWSTSASMCEA